ncbi:hypothetical protein [Chryseobacterium sp.]|uniref:hypothetical protein n=1 Tax=Chryseobacterium sp. TaxID=1871047 RepID=UPI0025C1CC8F|nr:hypothetical protein [Chryseobacterium sp.]MBV8328748.1 hypothetical protein [Chryseobacterium sp.]
MRSLKKLKITESIHAQKLIFEESQSDEANQLLSYILFAGFVILPLLMIIDFVTEYEPPLFFIPPFLLFCFGLHGLYCQITEKRLMRITTHLKKSEIKDRIFQYAQKKNFRISENSDDTIFLNEPTYIGFDGYDQTTLIFINENQVLFTVIKETSRFNTPVLFAQYGKRRDLKRILR